MLAQLRELRKRYSWIWRSGFPFLATRRPTDLERLRARSLSWQLADRGPLRRLVAAMLMTLAWPVASVWNAAEAALLDRKGGTGPGFRAYLRAALGHNALIPALRRLHAVNGLDPADAPHLLYDRETSVWTALNARRGADPEDVQDKARFHAILARHGLPAVPVLQSLPAGDLIAKPRRGNRGQGVQAWRWSAGTGWSNGAQTCRNAADLLDLLPTGDWIVQPLLRDAAPLRAAGSGGLSSIRVVTVALPDGTMGVAAAALMLARGLLSQDGELYALARGDGRLTAWYDADAQRRKVPAEAPQAFPLAAVPDWQAITALALDAHRIAFPRFATLGWDVVLVDGADGQPSPLLLEANRGWGVMIHQLLDGPIGHGPLGAAAGQWLATGF